MKAHDWRAFASVRITEGQASAAHRGSTITLGMENLSADPPILVGCFACEQSWPEAAGKPCPGEPPGTLAYIRGTG